MNREWSDADFDKYRLNLELRLMHYCIPIHMHEGILHYILMGRATGSFLQAVFSNNLCAAVARGDDENQGALVRYVKFLHNHAPIGCYGSEKAVDFWKEVKGLKGLMEREAAKHQ